MSGAAYGPVLRRLRAEVLRAVPGWYVCASRHEQEYVDDEGDARLESGWCIYATPDVMCMEHPERIHADGDSPLAVLEQFQRVLAERRAA